MKKNKQSEKQKSIAKILIIDDDVTLCSMLIKQLNRTGHETGSANTLEEGLLLANGENWDCILLDVQMPDGNGLEYLPQFIETPSSPEVIIITGHGAADGAEKAIRGGAWSYIEKPHVIRDLPLHLIRALQFREEKQRIKVVPVSLKRGAIIGQSNALNKCLDRLATAASNDINVLITGETGTGKELFSQALHDNSNRSEKPFVVVDCASLPDTLIESTLFGHVKGAFTGADRAQEGLIQHAHNGTLFLDEVGELPLAIQKNFLRILQERKFRPVGGTKEIISNFRLVTATNRDLSQMVTDGRFRGDLLFRLHAMNITLPPLRDRLEDVRELVVYFLGKLCERYQKETKGIAPDFIENLAAYNWPGNIRELHQTVEQIFAESVDAPTLYSIHLPQQMRIQLARDGVQKSSTPSDTKAVQNNPPTSLPPWKTFKIESERNYMKDIMRLSNNNIKKACDISSLSRARIYQLLEKHGINSNPQK